MKQGFHDYLEVLQMSGIADWGPFVHLPEDRFFNETFAGDYQKQLLDEFNTYLPANLPWEMI